MRSLILFDVDGTLTKPREKITKEMIDVLRRLSKYDLGFVGGSNFKKQEEQLGKENFSLFKWRFSENGIIGYNGDEKLPQESFVEKIGESKMNNLINIILEELSKIRIPKKRGTFIEYRTGMLNVSPIGRNCNSLERKEFHQYDIAHGVRKGLINKIKGRVNNLELKYSLGSQISIDIFPRGWDKTYCLKYLSDKYSKIYFFGDNTGVGGNDYELYHHPRVISYSVNSYLDTMAILKTYFLDAN